MTDEELARRLTEALDTRIDRAASAPVSREILNRLPEPETIGGTVVEAIPVRQARWKSALAAVLAILMLGGVGLLVFRLAGRTDPTSDPHPAYSGSTDETGTTEPTVEVPLPEVSFDEATRTLRVVGTGGYDRIDLSRLPDALNFEVVDDDFTLTVLPSLLWDETCSIKDDPVGYMPGYLDRVDKSLAVIRQFVADNAPNEEVAAQTRKPVKMSLQTFKFNNYRNNPDEISLILGGGFRWHGVLYTMGLMAPESVEWQHIGYAYWVGFCVDPYNSVYTITEEGPDPDYFYFDAYYRAGGTEDWLDLDNQKLMTDACSWYDLVYGRDWDGTEAECGRISDNAWFAGSDKYKDGNGMSLSMAESLLNYLAERCGADRVTAYCFDACSFEEAFGMSFGDARAAWEQSLLDRFGDGGEAAFPGVSFDEETKTLRVTGTGGYNRTDLSRLPDAQIMEVVDDDFTLTIFPSILWDEDTVIRDDPEGYLPGYLDRIDGSLAVIRQFVADNAPNEEVAAQTRKPVKISLQSMRNQNYRNTAKEISLYMGSGFPWHGLFYTMALMSPKSVEWQHIGYAYWVSYCVDPYNSVYALMQEGPDPDYFYLGTYYRAGGTEDWLDPNNQVLIFDVCSWYDLIYGRDWGGSEAECGRISDETMFTGKRTGEGNDMSIAMAESLLNYLADRFGTDKVTAYCFDTCTFEEAFGMDFAAARAAWEQSLLDRFGDGSEVQTAEPTEDPALPAVSFDEATKTLRIVGTEGYDRLDLAQAEDAKTVEVEDDGFRLTLSVSFLKSLLAQEAYYAVNEEDVPTVSGMLPRYLECLDRSTQNVRRFIADHAPSEEAAAQTEKPVNYSVNYGYSYKNSPEQIDLNLGSGMGSYDYQYVLSLMDPKTKEWQHLGFAYWIEMCADPDLCSYAGVEETDPPIDYYYYKDYYRVGGTGRLSDPKERSLLLDANSWYDLVYGRDWPGGNSECGAIYAAKYFSGNTRNEGNDMSLCMAASLLNYLAEHCGTDQVFAYCYDTCSFEEAFGMDLAAARAAWEQSLLDRFGDGETEAQPTP